MSSALKIIGKGESREIDLSEKLLSQMGQLCMAKQYSDVTFEVEGEEISGHVLILAALSEYFRALLFGGFDESKQQIIKLKVPICAFKAILKYIYTGRLALSEINEEDIQDVMGLANQYGFTELDEGISEYLYEMVSLDNVCAILNAAELHGFQKLESVCHKFLDMNANGILNHESFKDLREQSLKKLLLRDSFFMAEFQIFTAVREWCKHNSNVAIESVASVVRLPLMSFEQLSQVEQFSGIFDSGTLLKAINEKATSTSLNYRKRAWKEINIATEEFGARVTQGERVSALLDGDTKSYDVNKGFAQHIITEDHDFGIIIELGPLTIINHIKLLLLDRGTRCYSYFVEVSINQKEWNRIVDYQSYHCRSWQFLYFPARVVRYIKLVGTNGSVKPVFEVVTLEAYDAGDIPKMIEGIIVPSKNVATIEMGAVVNNNQKASLINGDVESYDSSSGYTWCFINDKPITVQLGQPYVIGSMRLLLLDCDNSTYSYYVETSINMKDWEIVVDRRNQDCRSWQNLVFEPRTVVSIRITGTKSTATIFFVRRFIDVLQCVHFECPSQMPKTTNDEPQAV